MFTLCFYLLGIVGKLIALGMLVTFVSICTIVAVIETRRFYHQIRDRRAADKLFKQIEEYRRDFATPGPKG